MREIVSTPILCLLPAIILHGYPMIYQRLSDILPICNHSRDDTEILSSFRIKEVNTASLPDRFYFGANCTDRTGLYKQGGYFGMRS